MIDSILERKNVSLKVKITVKTLISVMVVALSVGLPQLVHLVAGPSAGVKWLPMYLPVLIGGCILGWKWGICIGILAPVSSFLITSLFGSPMPALARLPFMMMELSVFAVVSGLFSNKIAENSWYAFPAVLLAEVAGRLSFLLMVYLFQAITPFTPMMIWQQIQTGLLAIILQAVIVPIIVILLQKLLNKDKVHE